MSGQSQEQRDEWEKKLINSIEELNIAAVTEPANMGVLNIDGKIKKVGSAFVKLE